MQHRLVMFAACIAAGLLGAAPVMAQAPADPAVRRVAKLLSFSMAATLCEAPLSVAVQTKLDAALDTAFLMQKTITLENIGDVTAAMGAKFMENEASNCAQFRDLDVSAAIDEAVK